jgi:hypothetical protein
MFGWGKYHTNTFRDWLWGHDAFSHIIFAKEHEREREREREKVMVFFLNITHGTKRPLPLRVVILRNNSL